MIPAKGSLARSLLNKKAELTQMTFVGISGPHCQGYIGEERDVIAAIIREKLNGTQLHQAQDDLD